VTEAQAKIAHAEKLFSPAGEKSIDSQMGMIIIERNRSRDWLVTQKP
jgi:hypothetical protein